MADFLYMFVYEKKEKKGKITAMYIKEKNGISIIKGKNVK